MCDNVPSYCRCLDSLLPAARPTICGPLGCKFQLELEDEKCHACGFLQVAGAIDYSALAACSGTQLAALLRTAGLPTSGRKADRIARLLQHQQQQGADAATASRQQLPLASDGPQASQQRKFDTLAAVPGVRPGTAFLGPVATAAAAAAEKMAAGEHRGVEHVALADDGVVAVIAAGKAAKRPAKKQRL